MDWPPPPPQAKDPSTRHPGYSLSHEVLEVLAHSMALGTSMALARITPPHPSQPGEDQAEQSSETICKEKVSPNKSRLFLRGEVFNGGFLQQLLPTEQY